MWIMPENNGEAGPRGRGEDLEHGGGLFVSPEKPLEKSKGNFEIRSPRPKRGARAAGGGYSFVVGRTSS